MSTSKSFVSVIIPVYNDADSLQRCLEALDHQLYPRDLYEVIVVDNGSDVKIDEIVKKFHQVVLTYESRPGSYSARNKGISIAKGEIIAFTDSDCIPLSYWISNAVANFLKQPTTAILAGKISLFFKNPKRLTSVEVYEKFKAFNQKNKVENHHHGVTANLFTYKRIFVKEGLFSDKLKSGGDVEWCHRMHARGYKLLYADDVCVAHSARNSFGQLYQKTTRVVGGIYDRKRKNSRYSMLNILKDLYNMTAHIIWLVMAFILRLPFFNDFNNTKQKVQYICVAAFVKITRIFEKTRLQLGAKSRR